MSTIDLNNAETQREFGVIPRDTVVPVMATINPGENGELLTRSKDGQSVGLSFTFTVLPGGGEYAKRKIFARFTIDGEKQGHKDAGKISLSKCRAMIEAAKGIHPDDMSEEAKAARAINSFDDLDRLMFQIKLGVERETKDFPAKNTVLSVLTPDMPGYVRQVQVEHKPRAASTSTTAAAAPTAMIQKPNWIDEQ